MILVHGTTRQRAERILANGPDPRYLEPSGIPVNEGFSTYLKQGPFMIETPEKYALGKARLYANEGGPVILELDVPDDIVNKAVEGLFDVSWGLVQFDVGAGIEELWARWDEVRRKSTIRSLA